MADGSCNGERACFQTAQAIGPASCLGDFACAYATGTVADDACLGYFACLESGDAFTSACWGEWSCSQASGPIGVGSCHGYTACNLAGAVGDGSCNADSACEQDSRLVLDSQGNRRVITTVGSSSCNDELACASSRSIGDGSCSGYFACYQVGSVGDGVCNADRACPEPDAKIKRSGGDWKGWLIHTTDGADQTVRSSATLGHQARFYIVLRTENYQNDVALRITANTGSELGMSVRYFIGSTSHEITADVLGSGYETPVLTYQERFVIRVRVDVTDASSPGDVLSRLIVVSRVGDPLELGDAVGLSVRRR